MGDELVRRFLSLFAALSLASCGTPLPTPDADSPRLVVPHVGQGSGALVFDDAGAIAFDAGPDSSESISNALRDIGVARVDLLVVSHWDLDHVGGLDALIRNGQVRGILHGGEPVDGWMRERKAAWCRKLQDGCRIASEGMTFDALDGRKLQVVRSSPMAPSENERSLVVRLVDREGAGLLLVPGDLDTSGEASILAHGAPLSASALLVGHHGSRGSSSLAFLGRVGARVAIIQAGDGNAYGHPHAQALERLRAIIPDIRVVGSGKTESVSLCP